MSEMIERVALEIQAAGYNPATAMGIARIAIEAMREPTAEMIIAGQRSHRAIDFSSLVVWRAMIDRVLK